VLLQAGLAEATHLFVAVPSPFEAGRIIEQARAANPKAKIVARAYTDADVDLLKQMGADHALIGEQEIAAACWPWPRRRRRRRRRITR
jgi:CPA2 family monovalent cation:H+ antiporter-2